MKLRDAVEKRADVKRFDLKKPDWRKVVRAIDMARFAPGVAGAFSARFILVDDEKVIGKLADASQQSFIGKAKMCVIVVSDDKSLVRSYDERGELYGRRHCGAVIQNFLLGLEENKLVTSWVWYFDDEQVRSALGIPGSVKVEGIFPVGKKTKIKEVKKRRVAKLDNILFFHKYGNKKMTGEVVVGRGAI
ncbi:nitroreductase family protein [Methanococcoides sp. SA1]|nr:nitroreductase family protein [Methanococcoides sp. SA1]